MADEIAELNIDVNLDPSDAIQGAQKLQSALDQTGDAVTELANDTQQGSSKQTKALEESVQSMKAELDELRAALAAAGEQAGGLGHDIPQATVPAVEGLEDLQDSAGHAAGGISAIGGAISVTNPALGMMFSATSALISGFEGVIKLTRHFGASVMAAMGPVGLGVAAVGGLALAISFLGDDAEDAAIDTDKLADAIIGLESAKGKFADTQLELRVERGELTALQAEMEQVAETAREKFAQEIEDAQAPFAPLREAALSTRDALAEVDAKLEDAATGSIPGGIAAVRQLQASQATLTQRYKEQVAALEQAISGTSEEARVRRGVMGLVDQEIASRTELLQLRIDSEAERAREAEAAKREAAAARARAQARARQAKEEAEKRRLEAEQAAELQKFNALVEKSLDQLAVARGEEAVAVRNYGKEILELNKMLEAGAITNEQYAELLNHLAQEQEAALDAIADARKQQLDVVRQTVSAELAVVGDSVKDVRKEYKRRVLELQEAYESEQISAEEHAKFMVDLEEDKNARIADIRQRNAELAISTASMVAGLVSDAYSREMDLAAAEIDKAEEQALAKVGDSLEEQEKVRREFDQRRKDELSASFEKQKELEIAMALISAASASVAALSAPPTGLGPVGGLALIPLIAAAAAGQIATIQQQQPSFHQGGIVGGNGDQLVNAQAGEVVLNRDTVARMGGADSANSLNSGAGIGQPVVIELTYKQKVLDRVIADSLRKGGPLKSALNDAARIGRRGRTGGRL